jgi:hypothetical protein
MLQSESEHALGKIVADALAANNLPGLIPVNRRQTHRPQHAIIEVPSQPGGIIT